MIRLNFKRVAWADTWGQRRMQNVHLGDYYSNSSLRSDGVDKAMVLG